MKGHLHNSLRALFLSLTVLMSLPMLAEQVEIDGVNYDFNAETKQATVIAKSSGKYSGEIVILESVEYGGTTYRVTSIGNSAFSSCYDLTSVSIGNNVTSIGNSAFQECSGLTSVTIPNSVESIGNYAFQRCSGLSSVTIGNSVTNIGDYVFAYCYDLTSVSIGNNVTSIGDYAFAYCSGLSSVTIPNSVKSLGNSAFYFCSRMTSVTIGNNVTSIGDYAFASCNALSSVTIPNSVKSLGNSAFYGCSGLTSVTIPNSVTSIGNQAFWGCSGLTSITIPNSVTSIGNSAFQDCAGLTSVTIGSGVNDIGDKAFAKCSKLLDVYCYAEKVSTIKVNAFDSSNPKNVTLHVPSASVESYKKTEPWSGFSNIVAISTEIDGINYAFNAETKQATVIQKTTNYSGKIVIPESVEFMGVAHSVKSIGYQAFAFCSGLTSVTIPNSVTSIGGQAFKYCSGLTSIVVEEENTVYDSRNNCNAIIETASNSLIYGCNTSIIPNSVTSIGNYAFFGCSGLSSVTIPNSVKSIGNYAFYACSGLTSVTIPNSVTSIGQWVFSGCSGLVSVIIPNSVTSIWYYAFESCSGLQDVYCHAENVPSTSNNTFLKSNYKNATLHVPAGSIESYKATEPWSDFGNIVAPSTEIDGVNYDFNAETKQATVIAKSSGKYSGEIVIPESVEFMGVAYSVTSIGDNAFYWCSDLTSVTIPNSVKSIGGNAFGLSRTVSSVHISDIAAWCNIEFGDFNSNPLYNAHHLYLDGEEVKDLVIPNNVTSIGDYAFSGCSGLTSVTIPNSVKSIGYRAFNGCSGLTSVHISDIVAWCNIEFLDNTSNPLYNAHHLYLDGEEVKDLVIPNNVTSIGDYAFSGCSGLTSVTIPNSVKSIGGNAFSGCSGLTSVHISDIVAWCNIDFKNGYSNPLSYAHHLYLNGEEVKDLVIPNSVTNIGGSVFYKCSGLTSVTIPNSVTSIGGNAFFDCSGLTSITIPNSVTSIGGNAFSDCSGLTSVHISDIVAWCNIDFLDNTSNPLYNAHHLYLDGEEVKDLVIPNSVTSIGDNAFAGCSGLTSIIMGIDIKNIGTNAFVKCSGLLDVYCYAIKLPSTESDAFDGSNPEKVTLHVPSASVKSYTQTEPWSGFGNIVALSTEIDGVNYDFNAETKQATVIAKSSVKYSGEIVIPESVEYGGTTYSVTSIGTSAFSRCSGLSSVTIPNSVSSIGDDAFLYCTGLTSVNIPNGVKSIGGMAFWGCSGLTSVTIGNSVESIGEAAFCDCIGLLDVYCYAENVPSTESYTFEGSWPENATLHVPDASVDSYEATEPWSSFGKIVALSYSEVEIDGINYELYEEMKQATVIAKTSDYYSGEVAIPESVEHEGTAYSVTSVGDDAFYWCDGLTSVTIPNSVTSIGDRAFLFCSGLTSVTIPNSVTSIGGSAFMYCSGLTSVTIGNSVESIGEAAFYDCSGLTSIVVDEGNSVYDSRNNCNAIIKTATNTLHSGCQTTVIPNSVTSIGSYAFAECDDLTSVTIPNSVTSIGDDAFHGCDGLTSVTIPNSVTSIGDDAFYGCDGLTSVTIGNSVKSIGDNAFYDCSGLSSVTIPNSVTSIRRGAFGLCSGLTSIVVEDENTIYDSRNNCNAIIETASNMLLCGCQTTVIPNSVESIGDRAFYGCDGLTSVTIPNSVTSIGEAAFYDCSGLTSVTIGNSVTSIGDYAFWDCSGLTSVTIPNSVTSIGDYAFGGCSGLTSVTIGNSVESIGDWAFYGCSKLLDVYCYAENVPSIGSYVFFSTSVQSGTLHVPAGSIDSYRANSDWDLFRTITPILNIALSDGADFENDVEQSVTTLTYTRTLPNLYWNALYVPFEIPVSEIIDKYEVAYVNNVNSYDHNDDGTIDDMRMEVIKIKSGTLNANYPYLIKARNEEAKNMTITLENTTLFQSVETTIDCSSVFAKHEITGIYNKRYKNELPEGAMAISMAGAWQPIASGSYLNPFRLYMTITARDGSPVKVEPAAMSRIRISVLGEDVETDIEETRSETKNIILDLSGRSVQNPVKGGVYIVNGKKVIF